MASGDYLVRFTNANGTWQEFQPSNEVVILGRAPECDLVLNAKNVSRQHARLQFTTDGVFLTDLASTNGTQLNGQPLTPRQSVPLPSGQSFTVGSFTVQWIPQHSSSRAPVKAISSSSLQPADSGCPPLQEPLEDDPKTIYKSSEGTPLAVSPYSLDLSAHARISIGRAADNIMVLEHPMVSHYHAEIERVGARVQMRDLRSTNGVFVNNERLEHEIWLKDGDRIQVGPYVFLLSGLCLSKQTDIGLTLETKSVNKFISEKLNLLKNISLCIKPMEFVAVVGMSGSGKTTLLNVLSGYSPATSGKILINGTELYTHYDQFRNEMGYVPQKDIVHAELTPFSALMFVARLRMPADTNDEERKQAVMHVLAELDLTERKDVPIARLSGGQLKRVSIGVELLTRPRLFFLDEPTSGLDPGTEYEMMHLMRRLADQGRTVILVTHATKNVILCDKVVFLARGGYLVFFGPPDEALAYFDKFRIERERRQKTMEFDDIYRILSDEKRGTPTEWSTRFLESHYYKATFGQVAVAPEMPAIQKAAGKQEHSAVTVKRPRVSAFQQFLILSQRNLKILWSDKVSIALMLALAPAIGLLDFIWGNQLYDPVKGDAGKIISMWFMTALITVLVGALASVREIVKEADIYQRERVVNLMLVPYILSKVWVGVALALYQAGVLMLTQVIFNHPNMPYASTYLALYITLFLCTLCGYLLGLMISAGAPNQNSAMLLVIAVLVPQFLFSGALLPLDSIPGGEVISTIMPTRWAFESFLNMSMMGDTLVRDACWTLPATERKALTTEQKKTCTCLGVNIFKKCNTFPGVLSTKYYNDSVATLLEKPAPMEPPMPTAIPFPTAIASPTPLPTPTMLPSPTALATPLNPQYFQKYMEDSRTQSKQYQDTTKKQFDEYSKASEKQGQSYGDQRSKQGDEYAALRQKQGDEYKTSMTQYVDDRSSYEESRQKAISSAESVLENMYENFGRAFKGTVPERWANLGAILVGLLVLLTIFQKRKDVI